MGINFFLYIYIKKSKIDHHYRQMNIINRYKNEVNKSMDFLKEEGVITEDQLEKNE